MSVQAAPGVVLGYVLSGSTTSEARFIVADGMESAVREGMYVAIHDARGQRVLLAQVYRLSYFHEFYDERDVWAEAIKKGHRPPQGVGRSFLLASLGIIGEISGGALVEPPRPPSPGSEVRSVTGGTLAVVFGHDPSNPSVPPHLLPVGTLYGYSNMRALLDLRALTMHIGVIGTTGSGKTNTVSVILERLGGKNGVDVGIARLGRTVPAFVLDLNSDYKYLFDDPSLVPAYDEVVLFAGSNSPLCQKYGCPYSGPRKKLLPLSIDLDVLAPHEVAEAIAAFYKGGNIEGSMLMINLLARAFEDWPNSKNLIFSSENQFKYFIDNITNKYSGEYHRSTIEAAKRSLQEFYRAMKTRNYDLLSMPPTLDRDFVEDATNPSKPKLVILDMSPDGLPAPLSVKQFITYYLAQLLYNSFVEYRSAAMSGSGNMRVVLFVIEEAQNFAPNLQTYRLGYSVAKSILSTIATQGRKFGISLLLVTQRPLYVDPVVMSMMNTFIIHRVPAYDTRFVERVAGMISKEVVASMPTMEKGSALIVGQMNPSPLPMRVKIDRRKGP